MANKVKSYEYRKFYEQQTGVELPFDWDVHHLDLNHNNNDFDNLLAVPRSLHRGYHCHLNDLKSVSEFDYNLSGLITKDGLNQIDLLIDYNKLYIETIIKINSDIVKFIEYFSIKSKTQHGKL